MRELIHQSEFDTRKLKDRWVLRLTRVEHRLFGRRQGCSCITCFYHPERRVPPREIYNDRTRLAKLEEQVRELKKQLRESGIKVKW